MKDIDQLNSPSLLPPGVEVFWSNPDPADTERYIIGADFHSAELRLNRWVDLSPEKPLTSRQADCIFLASLGMTRPEQADYWRIHESTAARNVTNTFDKLRSKRFLHHAIRRLFQTGIIEVAEPLVLAEPPGEETHRLVNILCKYDTLHEADKKEKGNIPAILGKTTAHYGLRGLYDFMTWAHAAEILDSSPPTFVELFKGKPRSKPRPNLEDAFTWHKATDGFIVDVFNDEEPCATLEFKGDDPQTALASTIHVEGGRIALRNFFDTSEGRREHLSPAELGALVITVLGGELRDIERLGIGYPEQVQRELYEKIGVPSKLLTPYAPIRAIVQSFDQKIMICEAPPKVVPMTDRVSECMRYLGRFDSHQQAAQMLDMTYGSVRNTLSNVIRRSDFPGLPGVYLTLHAAEAYTD